MTKRLAPLALVLFAPTALGGGGFPTLLLADANGTHPIKVLDESTLLSERGYLAVMRSDGVPNGAGASPAPNVLGEGLYFEPDCSGDPYKAEQWTLWGPGRLFTGPSPRPYFIPLGATAISVPQGTSYFAGRPGDCRGPQQTSAPRFFYKIQVNDPAITGFLDQYALPLRHVPVFGPTPLCLAQDGFECR